jgi:hypothetical protein
MSTGTRRHAQPGGALDVCRVRPRAVCSGQSTAGQGQGGVDTWALRWTPMTPCWRVSATAATTRRSRSSTASCPRRTSLHPLVVRQGRRRRGHHRRGVQRPPPALRRDVRRRSSPDPYVRTRHAAVPVNRRTSGARDRHGVADRRQQCWLSVERHRRGRCRARCAGHVARPRASTSLAHEVEDESAAVVRPDTCSDVMGDGRPPSWYGSQQRAAVNEITLGITPSRGVESRMFLGPAG